MPEVLIEGVLANGTRDWFGDISGAFDCSQSCSRTGVWRSTRGAFVRPTDLFTVSRDPTRRGSLAELRGTNIPRACNRSWNDERRLNGGAYDAACGDANARAWDRPKTRFNRLYP